MAPRVMTVSGPIPADKLGLTLPHEHTGIALWHIEKRWDYWELTPDEDLITEELRDFRRRGGASLVDLTLTGVGRDPHRLRRLASASGLNIVMGCGWYRGAHYPAEALIDRRSVDSLAEEIVNEFAHGVQSPVGLAQLKIFTDEGVEPGRVVIGHADSYHDLDFYLAVLDAGANLEFDFLGHRFGVEEALEPRLVETIVELLERGYASQLLLSQDVCHNQQLKANGGFGYVYLHQHFLPTLRTAAVGEGEIRAMTIDNPARILTIP